MKLIFSHYYESSGLGERDDVEGSECDGDFVAAAVEERTAKSASVGLTSLQAAATVSAPPVNPVAAYLSVSFWLKRSAEISVTMRPWQGGRQWPGFIANFFAHSFC